MIAFEYTITNKLGDTIKFNDHTVVDSLYALQAYPKFSRNIKNTEQERIGQNNYWDFHSYNGKMTVAFSGIILAPTHQVLEQKKALLQRVFAIPLQSTETNDGYVTITWTDDDGIEKKIEAKIIQDITFDRRVSQRNTLDFQIQLKLKNNYVEKVTSYTTPVTGQRGYFESGFLLSTLLPVTMTEQYVNKIEVTIDSLGALPKIKLYGENQQYINNPRVLNIDTGEIFQLDMTLQNASNWVEIDTENGTVYDESGIDVSGYINVSSGFLKLSTGVNRLVYLSDEDPLINGILPEAGTRFEVSYKQIYAS